MSDSSLMKIILFLVFGLSFACFGMLSYLLFPRILQWQVEENLILSPDAEPYEYWRLIPVPIYARFYFFNITNAEDILHNNAKPNVAEVGPYTFLETREKVNITWNDNGTVSYYQIKRWFFEPQLTPGSLEDQITTVNVPMMTAVNQGIMLNDGFIMKSVQAILEYADSRPFVTKSIGDLLFDGYYDDILEIAKEMGMDVPQDKFGWFYAKNNTHDGLYTIFTGEAGVDKYGFVDRWNGNNLIKDRNHPCNVIDGTAGDMWPPFRNDRVHKLNLFVPDICSSLHLSYLSEIETNEIDSYRYWLDQTAFDNGKFDSRNSCQCTNTCMPAGALDIAKCQHDAPAVVSFPHFLYADNQYLMHFTGLKPDPDHHKFIIDLEPKLGIPVNVEAKLQINVAVPKRSDIQQLRFVEKTIYYPILWFSESASINFETAEKLKFVTKSLPQYMTIACFISVVIGGILISLSLQHTIRRHKQKSKKKTVYMPLEIIQVKENAPSTSNQ